MTYERDLLNRCNLSPYDYAAVLTCDCQERIHHYVLIDLDSGQVENITYTHELTKDEDVEVIKALKGRMKGGDPYELYP